MRIYQIGAFYEQIVLNLNFKELIYLSMVYSAPVVNSSQLKMDFVAVI